MPGVSDTTARPTRRRFLALGALTLAGGGAVAAALETDDVRRHHLLHVLGLEKSPDAGVARSGTRLVTGTFDSRFMHRPVGYEYSVPDQTPVGALFCLHGRSGDHGNAFRGVPMHDFSAAAGVPLVVVGVDGGVGSYWHARANGTDSGSMVLEELVPMIMAKTGVTKAAVMGWSMGGYGALLAAETASERFKAVIATSPALWTSPGATAPGAFDNAEDYHRHDVFAAVARLGGLKMRIDCGTGDPFYVATRKFASLLPSAAVSFRPGFHDTAYWRSVALDQVRWLGSVLAGP